MHVNVFWIGSSQASRIFNEMSRHCGVALSILDITSFPGKSYLDLYLGPINAAIRHGGVLSGNVKFSEFPVLFILTSFSVQLTL